MRAANRHRGIARVSMLVVLLSLGACGGGGGYSGSGSNPPPPAEAAAMTKHAGDEETATVGTAVAFPPAVLVTDSMGNPMSGITVTFSLPAGEGGSVTGASAVSDSQGIATLGSWVLSTTAGADLLVARTPGVAGLTFYATGTAGSPSSVAITQGNNQTSVPGATVTPDPAVLVTDQYANPVSGVTVTFAVASGGGSVTGATPATGSNGTAAVGSWTLGPSAGMNTLTATVAGLPPAQFTADTANAGFTSVVAGDGVNCALKGTVAYCWGNNSVGAVGDGTNTNRASPTPVAGNLSFKQLTESGGNPILGAGMSHACGLTTSNQIYCWGSNGPPASTCQNEHCAGGFLGTGVGVAGLIGSNTPVQVAAASNGNATYVSVSAGETSVCAIGTDGHAYCWGNCDTGCGGTYGFQEYDAPTLVSSAGPQFVSISTTSGSPIAAILSPGPAGASCALTAAGATYCWGNDSTGPIGDTPTGVLLGKVVTSLSLSAAAASACAVISDGSVECWGQVVGTPVTAPSVQSNGVSFTQVSNGYYAAFGLTASGALYAWGANERYLFAGPNPVATPPGVTFTQISVGNTNICALDSSGNVWCAGNNSAGWLTTPWTPEVPSS